MIETVLFVDPACHKKTRSTEFIQVLLSSWGYKVKTVTPDEFLSAREPSTRRTGVVLLQSDHLGALSQALGYPTVVIPMYDATGAMPDIHWAVNSGNGVVALSRSIWCAATCAGVKVGRWQYFPEPAHEPVNTHEQQVVGYLWERRPKNEMSLAWVNHHLATEIDEMLVLSQPDYSHETPSIERFAPETWRIPITKLKWRAQGPERDMRKASVYFAPRRSEGIGMAFLGAMALGMHVVANDEPTHSEYIVDGLTGTLVSLETQAPVPAMRIRTQGQQLGYRAWERVVEGRAAWLESSSSSLKEFINEALHAPVSPSTSVAEAARLALAFEEGYEPYIELLEKHEDRVNGTSVGLRSSGNGTTAGASTSSHAVTFLSLRCHDEVLEIQVEGERYAWHGTISRGIALIALPHSLLSSKDIRLGAESMVVNIKGGLEVQPWTVRRIADVPLAMRQLPIANAGAHLLSVLEQWQWIDDLARMESRIPVLTHVDPTQLGWILSVGIGDQATLTREQLDRSWTRRVKIGDCGMLASATCVAYWHWRCSTDEQFLQLYPRIDEQYLAWYYLRGVAETRTHLIAEAEFLWLCGGSWSDSAFLSECPLGILFKQSRDDWQDIAKFPEWLHSCAREEAPGLLVMSEQAGILGLSR